MYQQWEHALEKEEEMSFWTFVAQAKRVVEVSSTELHWRIRTMTEVMELQDPVLRRLSSQAFLCLRTGSSQGLEIGRTDSSQEPVRFQPCLL